MARNRLNTEETVLGLVGEQPVSDENKTHLTPSMPSAKVEAAIGELPVKKTESRKRGRKKAEGEDVEPCTVYVTPTQRKAIAMQIALSDRPEDKDKSSIVRAALDAYLAEIIKKL